MAAGAMRQVGSILYPKLRVLQIYGANTGVGKTIFSSILCRAFRKRFENVHYVKPVSTGPLEEADDR
jgi:bifunctional dethiobiotin synthetase / adenosylmethionine---8-amino-7-oxononanoate aminotransferase